MTEEIRAVDVFTPGVFPKYTYVDRAERNLEERLRDALEVPGNAVSVSGPSKSGKTVLIERVVGEDYLIPVSGAGVRTPEDVWSQVLTWIGVPQSTTETTSRSYGGKAMLGGAGALKANFVVEASVDGKIEGSVGSGTSRQQMYSRSGLAQVIREIAGSDDFVILIDDFHYIERGIQEEVARQIKEAVGKRVKIVTASVPHRADDVVRSNPELRGRLETIDFASWKREELLQIADLGFQALNSEIDVESCLKFATESLGSPQLMQAICLAAARRKGLRVKPKKLAKYTFTADERKQVFEGQTSIGDFRSLVQVLDQGPKTRGTERKIHQLKWGATGDVYRCLLHAIASDPPVQSLTYREITSRTEAICVGAPPAGSSVVTACAHMHNLAAAKFPNEVVFDWDEDKQVLNLPDPYLLFFLRWSGFLGSHH